VHAILERPDILTLRRTCRSMSLSAAARRAAGAAAPPTARQPLKPCESSPALPEPRSPAAACSSAVRPRAPWLADQGLWFSACSHHHCHRRRVRLRCSVVEAAMSMNKGGSDGHSGGLGPQRFAQYSADTRGRVLYIRQRRRLSPCLN
jgi:hypothetical protein